MVSQHIRREGGEAIAHSCHVADPAMVRPAGRTQAQRSLRRGHPGERHKEASSRDAALRVTSRSWSPHQRAPHAAVAFEGWRLQAVDASALGAGPQDLVLGAEADARHLGADVSNPYGPSVALVKECPVTSVCYTSLQGSTSPRSCLARMHSERGTPGRRLLSICRLKITCWGGICDRGWLMKGVSDVLGWDVAVGACLLCANGAHGPGVQLSPGAPLAAAVHHLSCWIMRDATVM